MDRKGLLHAAVAVACIGSIGGLALGDLVEPSPEPAYRGLRDDHVKTWHIFNDSSTLETGTTDGVLMPGDRQVAEFKNWWTPVSAHTQHTYDRSSYGGLYGDPTEEVDIPSAPYNYADSQSAEPNYWLDQDMVDGALHFFMTYSQYDNNDWASFQASPDPTLNQLITERNMERNGYALGWANGNIDKDNIDPNTVFDGEKSILVHYGKGLDNDGVSEIDGFGTSRSNPNVSLSNDIDHQAQEFGTGGQWHPPVFNDDPGVMEYDGLLSANANYLATRNDGDGGTANDGDADGDGDVDADDFAAIVASMEVRERDPNALAGVLAWLADRPDEIAADSRLDQPDGSAYEYQDAFSDIWSTYQGSNDGGVIAGLAGEEAYDPEDPHGTYHQQQVIRIDFSSETLEDYDSLVFYDFGDSAPGVEGTDQVDPEAIVFGVDLNRSVADGQIYFDPVGDGNPDDFVWFPENRLYIAQVHIPEPITAVMFGLGGVFLIGRNRRKSQKS